MRLTPSSASRLILILSLVLLVCSQAMAASRGKNKAPPFAFAEKRMVPIVGTLFGVDSVEEFTAVGVLPDGDIVVAGRSWGPEFPSSAQPHLLGAGEYREMELLEQGVKVFTDQLLAGRLRLNRGRSVQWGLPINQKTPNRTGFVLRYRPDLGEIKAAVRFDWGVAGISQMVVLPDGDLLLAGRCTELFNDQIWAKAPSKHEVLTPDYKDVVGDRFAHMPDGPNRRTHESAFRSKVRSSFGSIYYKGGKQPGDAFVLRLSKMTTVKWATVFRGYRSLNGLQLIDDTWLGVRATKAARLDIATGKPDPDFGDVMRRVDAFASDGSTYRFGPATPGTDRGSADPHGRLAHDGKDGKELWAAYAWPGAITGHPSLKLKDKSTVRGLIQEADGHLVVAVEAEGLASTATRHPFNLAKHPDLSFANRIGKVSADDGKKKRSASRPTWVHLVRFHPEKLTCPVHTVWGDTSAQIDRIIQLKDGSIAICGRGGGPRIKGSIGGGPGYCAVFSKDLKEIRYSGGLPNMEIGNMAATPDGGLVIVGRVQGNGPGWQAKGGVWTQVAMQKEHGGGYYDAYIIRLMPPK